MILRCSLRLLALSLLVVAACRGPANRDDSSGTTSSVTASAATSETSTDDVYRHRRCARGIQSCSAAQAGQPCDPNNLFLLCTPQSNGSFCCLANAQQ